MIYGNFLGLPSSFWIPMIIFWIICGICCGIIANNKGYDSTYYGIAIVVGCLFGVFAMIFYASAKDLDMEKEIKDLTHKVGKLEYERAIKLYEAEDKPIKATSKVEKKETTVKVETEKVKEKKQVIASPNDENIIICPYCGFEQLKERKVCWKCGEELIKDSLK